MKIIFLSGCQGSGKTTIQKALYAKLWKGPKRFALMLNFADPIREMHDAVLNILHEYAKDLQGSDKTYRRDFIKDGPLMQVLGTQWGRNTVSDTLWIDLLKARISQMKTRDWEEIVPHVIIGDGRFENEFDAFPSALRVRLNCPEDIRRERCEAWRPDTKHASETGLDNYWLQDKFDLGLNTAVCDVEACVTLIMAQLDKNSWMEKRQKTKGNL